MRMTREPKQTVELTWGSVNQLTRPGSKEVWDFAGLRAKNQEPTKQKRGLVLVTGLNPVEL